MKKITATINIEYTFSPIEHRGAPYSVDGIHWMNGGELSEIVDKSIRGLEARKDANTSYDKGSDIEETATSVKSGNATLVNKVLGENFEEIQKVYFETCHSTNWDWVVILDDTAIIYNMNRVEFKEFMNTFGRFCADRKVIRFLKTSTKMLKWLDERL